jgi:biopolymer transport protein ExbD
VPQVAVVEQQAAAELHELEEIESDGMVPLQRQDARFADSSDPRLNFELNLDREGNTSVDGERIGLDELREEIAKLKDETSNAFSVRINADPECPAKHVVSVLDVCEEVGDVDYRVVSSKDSDVPAD